MALYFMILKNIKSEYFENSKSDYFILFFIILLIFGITDLSSKWCKW